MNHLENNNSFSMQSRKNSSSHTLNSKSKRQELFKRLRKEAGLAAKSNSKIPRRQSLNSYPLSSAQKRLWFLQELNPDNPFYNTTEALWLDGFLDFSLLEKSISSIYNRHEILRVSFSKVDGQPVQIVNSDKEVKLSISDLQNIAGVKQHEEIRILVEKQNLEVFRLDRGPLLKIALIILNENEHVLALTMHHIISDGFSFNIFLDELNHHYFELSKNRDSIISRPEIQYSDFAEWQSQHFRGDVFEKDLIYWKKLLSPTLPSLEIPTDSKRPAKPSFRGCKESFLLSKKVAEEITEFAQENECTLFMIVLSAYAVLLQAYTGMDEFVIGTPVAGRDRKEIEKLIGCFVNMLVLRMNLSENPSLITVLNRIKKTTIDAYAHQNLPFEKLVEAIQPERHLSNNPLFQVAIILDVVPDRTFPIGNLKAEIFPFQPKTTLFDLMLFVTERDNGLQIDFQYSTDLFESQTIKKLFQHYKEILQSFTEKPSAKISQLQIITNTEYSLNLLDWNQTENDSLRRFGVLELFREQVRKKPDSIAAICRSSELPEIYKESSISYFELNIRTNQIASVLTEKGIQRNELVGIVGERSIETLIGILGILKSGAAFVPIDPNFPQKRIDYIVKDSGVKIILIPNWLDQGHQDFNRHAGEVIEISNIIQSDRNAPDINTKNDPEDLAYIIYTSGTSGDPKGVIIPHRGLSNYASWVKNVYLKQQVLNFPWFTSLSFDLTITSIFVPLISGSTIIIHPEKNAKVDLTVGDVFQDDRVDIIKLTPSHLEVVKELAVHASSSRKLILGGEDLKSSLAQTISKQYDKEIEIYNEYGPTEGTVGCMIYRFDDQIRPSSSVPIGKPAANTQIYVLDKYLRPVPNGVIGELFISGDGQANGYLNQPALTAEKFIPDPFTSNSRMYRSGDLSKRLASGDLSYAGRVDEQAKIRGVRVEPREIEAAALLHPDVESCVAKIISNQPNPKPKISVQDCVKCGLPSNFPEISFNEGGICSICLEYESYKAAANSYFKSMDDLRDIFAKAKGQGENEYDCMMLLSGGKDSTYVLYQLVEMGLKVLVFSMDNGFISDEAKANIRQVVEDLNLELIFGNTPAMNSIFVDSLKRYSNVCNGCFKTIYTLSMNIAKEKGIRYIVTGLSRGQIFETRIADFFKNKNFDIDHIDQAIIDARKAYHLINDTVYNSLDVNIFRNGSVFEEIEFIDFYRYCEVSLDEMLDFLEKRASWIRPSDTGRSTNCLINELGIYVHKKERGYHNYALPYSWDVRLGHKEKNAAMEELDDRINTGNVERMIAEIGYNSDDEANGSKEKMLVLYYIAKKQLQPEELKQTLANHLPDYFLPSHLIPIHELPLTANGKIDLDCLPTPDEIGRPIAEGYIAPRNSIESKLANIWEEILKLDPIGIRDNFFDLGGHSLLITRMIARVNREFAVNLSIPIFFEATSIADLAIEIEKVQKRTKGESTSKNDEALIRPRPANEPAELSFAQDRLWFLNQMDSSNAAYNVFQVLHYEGALEISVFERAINEIIRRHEILRSIFTVKDGKPIQVIMADLQLKITVINLDHHPQPQREKLARTISTQKAREPFILNQGPLIRTTLFKLDQDTHVFLLTMHHIICDQWSIDLFLQELAILYKSFIQQKPSPLTELPIQYANFAYWQKKCMQGTIFDQQFTYWESKLSKVPPPLRLPFGRYEKKSQLGPGSIRSLELSTVTSMRLINLSKQQKTTLFTTILGAFATLLYRYTGQTDILLGSPIANRSQEDLQKLIGFFLNTIVLRFDISGNPNFSDFINRVHDEVIHSFANQDFPFERLVATLPVDRDSGKNPFFEIMVVFQTESEEVNGLPGIKAKPIDVDIETSKFDLTLFVTEKEKKISLAIEYNTNVLDEPAIMQILGNLQVLMNAIAENPNRKIADLPLLSKEEYEHLVGDKSRLDFGIHRVPNWLDLFEKQVIRKPNNKAVIQGDNFLDYHQLNSKANQLAHFLVKKGVKMEVPVGVFIGRSLDTIVGILGIIKAGGAYVPIDPECPQDRLAFILEDTQVPIVVTHKEYLHKLSESSTLRVCLDSDWEAISEYSSSGTFADAIKPDHLAYIIYTSGSSGRPKGVMITHKNLASSNQARLDHYKQELASFLLLSNFTFDSSIAGIFWTLSCGATLCIPDENHYLDPEYLLNLIRDNQLSHLLCIPSLYRLLLGSESNLPNALDTVILAGEACPLDLVNKHFQLLPKTELFNEYGPTEATVWSTVFDCSMDFACQSVPIGAPIPYTQIYVLDAHLQPVPAGVPGELYIGGDGVARGYLNDSELTRNCFLPHPFLRKESEQRIYKTGDRVRYLADGNLEFLGRSDRQIKIRGYRVELGDIENALALYLGIQEAAVVEKEGFSTISIDHDPRTLEIDSKKIVDKLSNLSLEKANQFLSEIEKLSEQEADRMLQDRNEK